VLQNLHLLMLIVIDAKRQPGTGWSLDSDCAADSAWHIQWTLKYMELSISAKAACWSPALDDCCLKVKRISWSRPARLGVDTRHY